MPPSAVPSKRALPSKETTLFKELLQLYEARQLKKGQKTADQILKKFPEHGETLCMKGLILTHMGKREEGLELVKKGIRFDLTSHIVWHVFGLIQKGEKNYEEALKSYTMALKYDKENLNLLQDAANLQTHLRLYENLQDTRETLLKLRPNVRKNWISLALAYHLNGNLAGAKKVLDGYEKTLKNVPDYDPEHSEVMVYHIRVLEDMGEYREALTRLDANAKDRVIVDRVAIMETRARLLSKLEEKEEAEQAWRSLIAKNSECYSYYRGYFALKGVNIDAIADDDRAVALQILDGFSDQLPKATAPRRLALEVAQGDDFKVRATQYLTNGLRRGVPSLFSDVKALYSNKSKREILDEIIVSLQKKFEPPSSSPPPKDAETPTTYLWTLYYLAQHQSHLQQYDKALSVLATALAHTPTLPELYTCKARTLKRAGDVFGAVKEIEEARRLDGQDRFLNTKMGKYCLRAELVDEASDILGLFTKKDAESPGADLEDMQSMLYLTEAGDSYNRMGKLGLALKKYIAIQKVFDDINKDQYDFHWYSIRRFNICTLMNMLKWDDELRLHPASVKSAVEAARILVKVFDDPKLASPQANSSRTDAEKKAQKKAKKAAAKSQEDSKKGANASSTSNEDKGLEPPVEKDDDPDGTKALATKEPLEQAWKYLKPIAVKSCRRTDVWCVAYDVAVRRKKYVQAARALLEGYDIDPRDPELHVRIIDFKQRVSTLADPLPGPVSAVVSSALSTLIPDDIQPETYNSQYLQRNSANAKSALAAAKASSLLRAPLNEVEDVVFGVLTEGVDLDVKTAQEAVNFLSSLKSSRADEFRAKCDARFPLATIFRSSEDQVRLRDEVKKFMKDEQQADGAGDKTEVVS